MILDTGLIHDVVIQDHDADYNVYVNDLRGIFQCQVIAMNVDIETCPNNYVILNMRARLSVNIQKIILKYFSTYCMMWKGCRNI